MLHLLLRLPQIDIPFDHILCRMTQDFLEAVRVSAVQNVHFGERMAKRVRADSYSLNTGFFAVPLKDFLKCSCLHGPAVNGDEKGIGRQVAPDFDIFQQYFAYFIAKRNVARPFSFSDHPKEEALFNVQLIQPQFDDFSQTKPGIQNECQHGIIPVPGKRVLVRLAQQNGDLLFR